MMILPVIYDDITIYNHTKHIQFYNPSINIHPVMLENNDDDDDDDDDDGIYSTF